MRVVANYSTSLFDYINSDKNLKEVLSQGADESLLSEGAKKTLREKGISLNGSRPETFHVILLAFYVISDRSIYRYGCRNICWNRS